MVTLLCDNNQSSTLVRLVAYFFRQQKAFLSDYENTPTRFKQLIVQRTTSIMD
jgi:hypothetical protein